jgi:hypothetical protein
MTQSNPNQPDLDWSQVKETVKLLTASVTQVECCMRQGDASVNTLTESFTSMVDHMNSISAVLNSIDDVEKKDEAIAHCLATSEQIQSSIIAFQFYDRLQQSLSHVIESLKGLSGLVEDPARLYNPNEWMDFRNQIRSRFTMESEKLMFDAIIQGKTIEEAINLANESDAESKDDNDDIELF